MHRDHDPLHTEIRNEQDELVEPPDGATYSGSYEALDTAPSSFDATGSHHRVFCASPDWCWILQMKSAGPGAQLAWAAYLVACDTCQRLCRTGHLDALRERIATEANSDWLLEYLDELLEQVHLVKPRR